MDHAPASFSTRRRILIVDDDAVMRYILTDMLEDVYEIEEAPNGQLALDIARSFLPTVVLTDLVMAHGDGWELIGELRRDSVLRDAWVIAISGTDQSAAGILDFGADDFLHKPFDTEELLARVAVGVRITQRMERRRTA